MTNADDVNPSPHPEAAPTRPYVLFEDGRAGGETLLFENPREIIRADAPQDVAQAFARMEAATRAGSPSPATPLTSSAMRWSRNFRRSRRRKRARPCCCSAPSRRRNARTPTRDDPPVLIPLTPAWTRDEYAERFRKCRDYIFAGDVYQINLTFPLFGRFAGDPLALYRGLRKRQPVAYGGVVALGDETVVSLSPEVFFEAQGRSIRARPMKGTAQRGFMPSEDMARAKYLVEDEKSRAENLMIVDLLRNDLSRLSEVGSVKVTDLFTVTTYPTLHQMTSGSRRSCATTSRSPISSPVSSPAAR